MKSGYTVQKLIEEFWNPSSSIFNQAIEFIPDRQNKDIENKFQEILDKQTDGIPIESLESISSLKDTRLNKLDEVWLEAIEEATSAIPELLVIEQNESHYKSREGDTALIGLGKVLKKGRLTLRKGIHSTDNAFRRMLKKDEKEFQIATRDVPFKSMAQIHLFELGTEISNWKHAQYRFIARVLEVTQNWALIGKIDEEESEITFQELISNLKNTYKDESEIHQTALEAIFEDINTKLKRNLELVGTIELASNTYSVENTEKEKTNFSSLLKVSGDNWSELISALSQRIHVLVNLANFKERLNYYTSSFLYQTGEFFQQVILDPHKGLKGIIEDAITELKSLSKPTRKELAEIGTSIHSKANDTITKGISEILNQKVEEKYLSVLLDDFINKTTNLAKDQPEKSVIVEDLNLEVAKPEFEIKTIDWQKFVQRMLGKYIATALDSRKLNLEEEVSEISSNYLEVLQIIETNLVVIDEVSNKEEEEPINVALQGLERSLIKVEEIEKEVLSVRDLIPEKVINQNKELVEKLSAFLVKQDLSEMKWMETQLKVKESAGDWSTKFTIVWAKLLDRLDLFQRFISKKYRKNEEALRTFLGLKKPVSQNVESTNLATFLYETDRKFEDLPFIYRRLFDFHREVEANFVIQNPLHFENCRKALELWKGGFPASVSLIGEKGSGKSTLIRFLNEEILSQKKKYDLLFHKTNWKRESILSIISKVLQLPESNSVEELVASIKKKKKGSIVVIENLQNCFVRNMNGYDSIKALLYIISETKNEVFWVVSCSRYAWNFLDVVFKVGEFFSHSITTDKLNAEEIESLILRRQKASGYQLHFIPDVSTQKSRAYKKNLDDDEASQEYLKDKYFHKLTNLAEGNATVAMILWIRSIKEFNDSHFIIESLDIINMASLDGLDSHSLFALSAFIMHDLLAPNELAMVLNDSESNCEMIISRLVSRGLLVKSGNYYELNDLIYRQVVRLLRNRNILL